MPEPTNEAKSFSQFALAVAIFVLVAFGFEVIGYRVGQHQERDAAVKAGVARYVADPATGAVRFEYLGGKTR